MFFKHIIMAILLTLGSFAISGCSGGEADYSLDEVQGVGGIAFTSRANLIVQKDADPVVELNVSSAYSVTYSIVGGTNYELFDLNHSTSSLIYMSGIDKDVSFPLDNSNIVIVQAKDINGRTNEQVIHIEVVDDINKIKPVILPGVITDPVVVSTDLSTFTTISVYNPRGTNVDYTLSDTSTFTITSDGELSLKQAAVYDPTSNNIYDVTITVTDPETSLETSILISVTIVATIEDLKPTIVSERFDYAENGTESLQIIVNSNIPDTLDYRLGTLLDEDLFSINDITGVLSFDSSPDHENPLDTDLNNIYEVEVIATDGNNRSDSKMVMITVFNIDDGIPGLGYTSFEYYYTGFGSGWRSESSALDSLREDRDYRMIMVANPQVSGDSVTYSLINNSDTNVFVLVGNMLYISVPDISWNAEYRGNVDVVANDEHGNSGIYHISIFAD